MTFPWCEGLELSGLHAFCVLTSQMLNIGQAAAATGVSAKMIRHYESVGFLQEAVRTGAGYRQYADADLQTLRFIRHARDLGFSIATIAQLLSLWHDRARPSREVKALAQHHIGELDQKARELLQMKATLEHLVHRCQGNDRPECPIIDSLADADLVPSAGSRSRAARGPRVPRRPG